MEEIIDAELEDFVKSHADDIVKEAAKNDLVSFASYIDPSLVLTDFHYTYYKILDMFIHGKIKKTHDLRTSPAWEKRRINPQNPGDAFRHEPGLKDCDRML